MNESYLNSVRNSIVSSKPSTTIRLLLMVLFVSITPLVSFGQTSQTFNSSGTFVVPTGVTSVNVQAWGAGGAGGGSTSDGNSGAGGGAGGYSYGTLAVTPNASIPYTVGTGGIGSIGNGTSGGNTSFSSIIANGGNGGKADGGSVGTGGTASGGSTNTTGGSGNLGGSSVGGKGGNAPASGGTGGTGNTDDNGLIGNSPGGGGGGGEAYYLWNWWIWDIYTSYSGGVGGDGRIIVSWCQTYSLTGPNTTNSTCISAGTSTITLKGTAGNLPVGTYTVTYNTDIPYQSGKTATMTVSTAGTGTFTATGLTIYSGASGTSTVTVTNIASGTCSNTISSNNTAGVTVYANPVGGAVYSGTTPICLNSSTGNMTLGGGYVGNVVNWEKRLNGGSWTSIANTAITYSESPSVAGTWDYRAIVGNGSCATTPSGFFTVVVNPLVTITLASTNTTVCQTTTIANLSYTATTGSPVHWQIDFDSAANTAGISDQNNGLSGTSGTIAINVPSNAPAGVYNGNLTVVTYTPSCSSIIYPITLTVNPNGVAGVSIAASPSGAICPGTSVTFTATPTNGGATPSYQWKLNNVNVGTNSPTYTNASLANANTIKCVMTSSSTCVTGNPATSNTITMSLLTSLSAAAVTPNTAQSFCPSGTGNLLTVTPTGGGTVAYQWGVRATSGGAITSISGKTASTYTPSFTDLGTGTWYVVCTTTPTCGSAIISNEITVTITGPTATGVSICPRGTGSLTSSYSCADGSNQTLGPNNAGTGANDSTVGTIAWTNSSLGGITVAGSPYTSLFITSKTNTNYLKGTNYGFSIPTNATIVGIAVVIKRQADGGSIKDNSIKIVKNGSISGTEQSAGAIWNNGSFGTASFGGSTNLWGATWTPTEINASNFGVALSANSNTNSDRNLDVDYMQITVTYTVPGSLDWYTASSGGTYLGSGSSFNPVGVTGSGLANTNTPGTTTYFAECSSNPGCRTPVTFVINPLPAAPTVTITPPTCSVNTGTITITAPTAVGMTYSIDGVDYTNTTGVFSLVPIGTYNVTAKFNTGCASSATIADIKIKTNTWTVISGIGSWSAGTPTSDQAVEFAGSYNTVGAPIFANIVACSCQVTSGAVTIGSGNTLTITNGLTVTGGSLIFENNASLVQTNNVANSGNITYKRTTTSVLTSDYTYWSSPVANQSLYISPSYASGMYFSYDDFASPEGWKSETSSAIMQIGKGYIIRGPQITSPPPPPGFYNAAFVGVPNNGNKTIAIGPTGTSNLLGNPYPSAIDADLFLSSNNTKIEGTIYFWTHNTAIQLASNIASGKAGTGVLAYTSDDYASYNGTGGAATSGGIIPTGKIAAGQAFFTTSVATGGTVAFSNAMRLAGTTLADKTGTNQQFFKTKSTAKTTNTIEKNRVWLNMTNTEGAFKQTLIGYVTDATNDYDSRFDGESLDGNDFIDFYSINEDKNLVIQGRALPFDENDQVPLGYKTTIDGDFTISINEVDGTLSNQAVFIEDKLTNTVFNLKTGNYTFNTVAGTFNDRFVLKYSSKTLSIDETNKEDGILVLYSNNYKTLIIHNNVMDSTVNSVSLFNVSGQNITNWDVKDLEQTNIQIPIKDISSGIYIVKVKTTKGESSKKIIVN